MKTIEEKARAYDKVRKKIAIRFGSNVADEFFAEFEESKDERIRKALKQYFVNSFQNNGVAAICGVHVKDVLAWLEKQGKTSPILSNSSNIGKVEQNPNWSEEDEINVYNIIHFLEEPSMLENNEPCKKIVIDWLKSLKERIGGKV